jgi:hypothetical protein
MKHSKLLVMLLIPFILLFTCGAGKAATQLDTPEITSWSICGEMAMIEWDAVPNASSYNIQLNGKEYKGWTELGAYFPLKEGETASFAVFAESNSNSYSPSNAVTLNLKNPSQKYSEANFFNAAFYSLEQLKKWAKIKGYQYQINTKNNGQTTVFSITLEDPDNKGIMSKIGRTTAGTIDGAIESVKNTASSLTAKDVFDDYVENYAETESLKQSAFDTASNTADTFKSNAKVGALQGAVNYCFQDTNIHYDFYFDSDKTRYACDRAVWSQEEFKHEELHRVIKESWNKTTNKNTYYNSSKSYNRDVQVRVGEDKTNELYPRWVIEATTVPTR